MKRYFIFMAIILGMIAPSVCAQTAKQKVAVYITGEVDAGYKKVIGSKLVTGVTRSDNYTAVERTTDFLAEISKEQDYQMSGAVSDNQIAKLGQQFGVRYVIVADVSEIFETLFISARMIDVQTGQIKSSAEGNLTSESIEGLTELSNALVYTLIMPDDAVKRIGPFTTTKALYDYSESIPKGYKMASKQDIENIQKVYKMLGKKLSYPIYTTISTDSYYPTSSYCRYDIIVQQLNQDNSETENSYYFYYYFTDGYKSHQAKTSGGYVYVIKEQ